MKIGEAGSEKVPTTVVHKEFDEDVLVANMRGLIPSWIGPHVLAAPGLAEVHREALRAAYCVERPGPTPGERLLGLRTLPAVLEERRIAPLAEETREAVRRHYRAEHGRWWLASEYVDELDQVVLMSHLADRSAHLSDVDRYVISAALDGIPGLVRPKVACFSMVMDTQNYFFYRKHHEHVPGIMLIEVVRQAMYAQYYRYAALARGEVSLTIENLSVDFLGFVNANYPVRIQVEDVRTPEQIAATPTEERLATFSQLGRVVMKATMRANPIRMSLFKRLRNIKPPAKARFIPTKNIAPQGVFTWPGSPALDGRIQDLSAGGVKALFDGAPVIEPGSQARFSMLVEGMGFVHATLAVRWTQDEHGRTGVGFQIVDIDLTSVQRLREAIKNFTFVNTRRGEL
ncbi:PilZ domain-containing protein [Aquincola sp. MAHUQ-54]|uniref:PilZ domain-containing protein n=1 Tax=Aquincola agrisoli TaxID=3119538 RepID=A0AAW9Q204_9BURK